jgi:hypothetical protein
MVGSPIQQSVASSLDGWFDSRRGMAAPQEIAPEAKKTFYYSLLMSLNTENEQDPQKASRFRGNYHLHRYAWSSCIWGFKWVQ